MVPDPPIALITQNGDYDVTWCAIFILVVGKSPHIVTKSPLNLEIYE